MSKKKSPSRKPSGTAAIKVVEDDFDSESEDNDTSVDVEATSAVAEATPAERRATKPARAKKADASSSDNLSVADIKKAAAFANSVGGLDKAVALLQILKVAKDVQ